MQNPPRIGLLIAQTGTPEAPTRKAVRRYLKEFLSDPRIVDLHPLVWLPILYLFVLTRRPARSAALYRKIWLPEGSPLEIHTRAQAEALQERLGGRFRVVCGMRYSRPRIEKVMRDLMDEGIDRILVFPMFPQSSASTTGSIYDAVSRALAGRRIPALRFVSPYYDHPAYIEALRITIEEEVARAGREPDRYLFSFHGLPRRYVDEGDPYARHCGTTARLLAGALGLGRGQWVLGFQSRFGREEWLRPYTQDLLSDLGKKRTGFLAAACPGFIADCLETLEEIGDRGARRFREQGGGTLRLVPCLNSHPSWIEAMADIASQETAGWLQT